MCGIFAYISETPITDERKETLTKELYKSQHRGPDNTQIYSTEYVFLGFHRLSINGIENGNQPMQHPDHSDIYMVCNGEIYNYKELAKKYNITLTTGSDCEIILHLYKLIGFNETITQLDGVFGVVVFDQQKHVVYAARDPIGVRSLYIGRQGHDVMIASEMKSIHTLSDTLQQFPVGHTWSMTMGLPASTFAFELYYPMNTLYYDNTQTRSDETNIMESIYTLFNKAVEKRLMSDKPIGCLLSGGFDSSIVAALLAKHFTPENPLHTFSIGLQGSPDLKYAKIVANFIGSKHHEVVVTEEEMLNHIEEDIKQIESYDTTTVRASVPMYILSKYIKKNTDITVVYSGEGSDEASGSYLYFHNAPNAIAFKDETVRLMKDLSYYDVLRCDKSIAGAGLEVRVPFLDKEFLRMYMNVSPDKKMPTTYGMEKYLLRKSFESYNLLPKEVLWRMKEGMSDGVSSQTRGWYEIIQERAATLYTDEDFKTLSATYTFNPPMFKEALWFRDIFTKYYPKREQETPYYWLPKWSGDLVEPSARALEGVYKKDDTTVIDPIAKASAVSLALFIEHQKALEACENKNVVDTNTAFVQKNTIDNGFNISNSPLGNSYFKSS